ncbi:type II toxin-antitoxin system VapC family toxin [Nitrospina watsonii]|uniref:PIN domain nuclease n=1 Tax=Nitrospina watsonii TaxID=1323948 RepID=A0ABN8W4Z9_9BACT|nr:type II toxin-antitoxin system VapC family toxin [Nitrospina watsonii]CAI2719230.1 PIN domain nuclease [Nitrospina watsonii]
MVSPAKLNQFLKSHPTIGLDSNILIYFIEANPQYHKLCQAIFEAIEDGRNTGVCSTLSLLEILVQPYRQDDVERASEFYGLLTRYPNMLWKDLTIHVADLGAQLRAEYNIKTPDAILLATAIDSGATAFIGNDAKLKKVQEIEILILDE